MISCYVCKDINKSVNNIKQTTKNVFNIVFVNHLFSNNKDKRHTKGEHAFRVNITQTTSCVCSLLFVLVFVEKIRHYNYQLNYDVYIRFMS